MQVLKVKPARFDLNHGEGVDFHANLTHWGLLGMRTKTWTTRR